MNPSAGSRWSRALSWLAFISVFGCFCPGPGQPPPVDSCPAETTGTVDSVQLATAHMVGASYGLGSANDGIDPRPLTDGDVLWVVRGVQGADMVGLRFVLRSANVPTCINQDSTITVSGAVASQSKAAVNTYPLALEPGARATKTVWFPGNFSGLATIAATVGGKSLTVGVRTLTSDECTSQNLCPCSTALACQDCEPQGLSDAGSQRWSSFRACVRAACADGGSSADGGSPTDAGSSSGSCEQTAAADGGACSEARTACEADGF